MVINGLLFSQISNCSGETDLIIVWLSYNIRNLKVMWYVTFKPVVLFFFAQFLKELVSAFSGTFFFKPALHGNPPYEVKFSFV